ncbi:MAG: zinc-ribbon domain containing protein [Chloroflexota bacterium]
MNDSYQDSTLQCRDCGGEFAWTAGEQAFYASKGLSHAPARCPSCRAAARAGRAGRPREFFPAVCDRCGAQTKVPFQPRQDKPIYCSSCYDEVRAGGATG